jgi:uncharacterized protein (TIGR03435 family)
MRESAAKTAFASVFGLLFPALVASLAAQAPTATFEVASVKRNRETQLTMSFITPLPGRVSARAVTLKQLVEDAYVMKANQIAGGPDWFDSYRFDIEAKAANNVNWEPDLPLMLQALLAERFRLTVHKETRDLPMFAIVVAKNGIKLTAAGECQPTPGILCGAFMTRIGQMTGRQVSLMQLANALSGFMDRPVVDKTALNGTFDIKLQWVPDNSQFQRWGTGAVSNAVGDPFGASIFTAFEEQLGLKLDAQRAPLQVLIVDRAEEPSEN